METWFYFFWVNTRQWNCWMPLFLINEKSSLSSSLFRNLRPNLKKKKSVLSNSQREWWARRNGTSFHIKFLEGTRAIDRIPVYKVCLRGCWMNSLYYLCNIQSQEDRREQCFEGKQGNNKLWERRQKWACSLFLLGIDPSQG